MSPSDVANKDATPWNILEVLELVNEDTKDITCVAEWDDDTGRSFRCEREIEQDKQVQAWKQLLDLPWGSKDSSEWRAALMDAATLLSCSMHGSVVQINSVAMAWASIAVLHTHKARGDQLLLGHGESATSKVVEGSKQLLRPRRATTASRPRALIGLRTARSFKLGASRQSRHGSGNSGGDKPSRKDSATDSRKSASDGRNDNQHYQAWVEDVHSGEPTIFQLDEEVQTLRDALLRDCTLEPKSSQRRLRSRSDPEVHMDDDMYFAATTAKGNARARSMPVREQHTSAKQKHPTSPVTGRSAREELHKAVRHQVNLPCLNEMIEREHAAPGPFLAHHHHHHQKQQQQHSWHVDQNLRQATHAGREREQHSASVAVAAGLLQRSTEHEKKNLEERIRSFVESSSSSAFPQENPFATPPHPTNSSNSSSGATRNNKNNNNNNDSPPPPDEETIQSSWTAYMQDWFQVLQLDPDCTAKTLFSTLPRPVLGLELQQQYREDEDRCFTPQFERDVMDFFRNMPFGGGGGGEQQGGHATSVSASATTTTQAYNHNNNNREIYRKKLKGEVSRWHPDKIAQRYMCCAQDEEEEDTSINTSGSTSGSGKKKSVLQLATRVTQVITTLLIARA